MKVGALCAGYGGIELGLSKVVETELAWVSEIEPNASRLLQHRYGVPNHGDLTKMGVNNEVLFADEIEPVPVVTAGFPCQPYSQAGNRGGELDERYLVDDVCRVARLAKAKWLILENVRGILTTTSGNALARVCAAMAYNGFSRWEWLCLRASAVGAPHKRDRWFCIATNTDSGARSQFNFRDGNERWPEARVNWDDRDNVERCSISGSFSKYEQAIRNWEQILGRNAPQPTNDFRLNHWFVEWMMGLPYGWVCGEDLNLSRTACLRMLGNGVVPQQAATAISTLFSRF